MFHEKKKIDMTDLGQMRFFLRIEVRLDGIFICQKKSMLRKF